jgi:hypothetical protein
MPSRKQVLIVLPVVGKPYIAKDNMDGKNIKDLQRVCFGNVEEVRNDWAIHPMFYYGDEMWLWVHNFIQSLRGNQYKLFVNDCGKDTEVINMALIVRTKDLSSLHGKRITKKDIDNCPDETLNLFGRCCIQVAKNLVEKFNETSGYKLPCRYIDEDEFEVESSSDEEFYHGDENEDGNLYCGSCETFKSPIIFQKDLKVSYCLDCEDPYAEEKAYDEYKGK